MSRAQRRATRGSARSTARSRRTPVRTARGRGLPRIPWIPIVVVVGIAGVVGLILYLVLQAGKSPGPQHEEARRVEADASAELPGEFINLPELYGDGEGYSKTAGHVREEVDYSKEGLPPVGGQHWGSSACTDDPDTSPAFCGPVPGGYYIEPWPPESLVHNMEHAGVVVWYNTSNEEVTDDLKDFATDHSDRNMAVVPLPDMDEETVAITSWSRRLTMPVDQYDRDKLEEFFDVHNCRFDPESLCAE